MKTKGNNPRIIRDKPRVATLWLLSLFKLLAKFMVINSSKPNNAIETIKSPETSANPAMRKR